MRKKLVNSLIAGTMLGMLCALPVLAETETAEGVTGLQSVSENSTETVSGNDIEKGDIAIDGDHFQDETFRNYVSENFDNDKDGKLSEKEIDNVTGINVSLSEIESLKGIEYFSKLTYLDCYNNELTNLDVSKNTELRMLNCHSNRLRSLDVSQNTALTELGCSSNQLTSLDVSQNTALTNLVCFNNQLTSLDVSKNELLLFFYCYNNQLSSLDVSQNTELIRLNCYSNRLRSLDVSQNTALTELVCSSNQLTSLDVSQNTALESLWCEHNQLTSLDISNCKNLIELCQKGRFVEDGSIKEYEYGNYCYLFFDKNVTLIPAPQMNPNPEPTPTPAPASGTADDFHTITAMRTQQKVTSTTQGSAPVSAPVVKKANTVKVTVKTPSVKAKNKKQTISASKIFKVSKVQGKISYKKVSGSKNLTISKTGKITVKKGTKAGTYKIKVAITAAGNENYKAKTVNKTVKVKVKK